jgi:hypothetical protein
MFPSNNMLWTWIFIHIHEIQTRRHWSVAFGDARYALVNFAVFYRSNLSSTRFQRYSPRGTARYVNAAIEIHEFDYGGDARLRRL